MWTQDGHKSFSQEDITELRIKGWGRFLQEGKMEKRSRLEQYRGGKIKAILVSYGNT